MQDSRSQSKLQSLTHNHIPIAHFDQQSTNKLLQQLQISMLDVQTIIARSKEMLGMGGGMNKYKQKEMDQQKDKLKHSSSREKKVVMADDSSQINFNISTSVAQSTIRDQLTYSITPGTRSRLQSQPTNPIHNSTTKTSKHIVLRKLVYQQTESITIPQPQNYLLEHGNQKQQANKNMKTNHIEVSTRNINQLSSIKKQGTGRKQSEVEVEIGSASASASATDKEDEVYRYEEEDYCIVVNKNRRVNRDKDSKRDVNENSIGKIGYFQYQNSSKVQPNKPNANQFQSLPSAPSPAKKIVQNYKNTYTSINQQPEKPQKCNSNSNKWISQQPRINRVKIFKQSIKKYCDSINQAANNKNQQPKVQLSAQIQENTCAKNQLENILIYNSHSRKSQQKIPNASAKASWTQHKPRPQPKSPIKITKKSESPQLQVSSWSKTKTQLKSPSRSPRKSPSRPSPSPSRSHQKKKLQSQFHSPSLTTEKKPTYIQKFINNFGKQPSPKSRQPAKPSPSPSPTGAQYSHPKKSPAKKNKAILQLQEHKKSYPTSWTREQFIQKMLEQCYVRRFLNEVQLAGIYQEFCARRVPRYQWEEKVIEKIFKKIHQFDDII